MKSVSKIALLCIFWVLTSAFDWDNAGGNPYTGTRRAAIERSGFPAEVQAQFLRMIAEDAENEKVDRPEGIHYREDPIPENFQFDWTMFGKNTRETNVVARTSKWKPGVSRMARVYRVQVQTADGGREYILFFPKACLNPSGKVRTLPICPVKVSVWGRPLAVALYFLFCGCKRRRVSSSEGTGQQRAFSGLLDSCY